MSEETKKTARVQAGEEAVETVNEKTLMDQLDELEADGRICCVRPQEPITISRFEGNVDTLTELYARGHREGRQALAGLQAYLAGQALKG